LIGSRYAILLPSSLLFIIQNQPVVADLRRFIEKAWPPMKEVD